MFSYTRLVALPDGSRRGIRHRARTSPSLSSPGLPLFPQRLAPSFSLSSNKMFRNKAESLHPDLSRSEKGTDLLFFRGRSLTIEVPFQQLLYHM